MDAGEPQGLCHDPGPFHPPDGRSLELWDFGVWTPVLQSTFYGGLFQVGKAVLDGSFHRPSRKKIREIEETE